MRRGLITLLVLGISLGSGAPVASGAAGGDGDHKCYAVTQVLGAKPVEVPCPGDEPAPVYVPAEPVEEHPAVVPTPPSQTEASEAPKRKHRKYRRYGNCRAGLYDSHRLGR